MVITGPPSPPPLPLELLEADALLELALDAEALLELELELEAEALPELEAEALPELDAEALLVLAALVALLHVGLATMGLGALMLTGGIIMTAVGSKKVPVRATEAFAAPPRWLVEPLVGVGTAGVKVRF